MASFFSNFVPCLILGFRHEIYENCCIVGYYAKSSCNFFPTFRDNLSVPKRRYQIKNIRWVISQKNAFLNFLPDDDCLH